MQVPSTSTKKMSKVGGPVRAMPTSLYVIRDYTNLSIMCNRNIQNTLSCSDLLSIDNQIAKISLAGLYWIYEAVWPLNQLLKF